ncbi:transcription factor E4F1-like [Lineus longissimus]|uniref:transcription factor E4F1-like n=1 Tax=Lineus longissimus TaxID=88925 RepID=UPI002B4DAD11
MAAESIDLQNFMDVITSYKCKFCTFTCQFAQGMASHVKHVHLEQGDALPAGLGSLNVEINSVAAALSTGTEPDSAQLEPLQGSASKDDGLGLESQVLQGLQSAESNTEIHDMSKDTPDIAAQYAEIVQEATQCMVTEGAITNQSSSEVAQATGSLEDADASVQTKELFLCGQCGVAFTSIDDCKQHMVEEHNVMLPADVESESTTKEVATHTDASTQVMPKKRLGRKRKIKDPSPMVMVNPVLIKSGEEETEHVETENIGKRRIRVPKALKDDYCLSKRVKIRRKTREMNKPFDLKCKHSNCLARFQLFSSLRIHEACHNNTDQELGGFVCVECHTHFLQWRTMRVHLWKMHKIDTDLYTCEVEDCDFKTDKVYKLNLHKEVHSEKRPYACNQCPKSFKQINQLRTHQIVHLGKSADPSIDKWYTSKICGICKRSFVNVKCLNKHIEAVHSKIKPFICQFCGHTAARKAMLQLHLRTHTGEKPFKCDQCSYTTGDHNSLRRHHMRHTGQKPYQCCYCAYACIQAISLKTHMKNKHPGSEGVFACNQCTYISVNKASLEHHLEDHKNGLVDITAIRSHQQRPGRVAITPVASTSAGQQTRVQTFTVQQNEQQTSQQVTVKAPDMDGGVQSFIANDLSAAQLIYSALSAIQQSQKDKSGEPISVDGMQATVTDNSTEGSSGHTITFHIPTAQGSTGDHPVLLLQQPVTQADSNVQDAISVAYNTNSIQSSLNQAQVSGERLEFAATQNEVSENEGPVLLIDQETKGDSGIVAMGSQTEAEDLLNHAATMVALRGNQEIVSLAAETAELPMKDDDAENVMETQLVQICSDSANIIQGADGTQFLQVMAADGQRAETLLQLAPIDSGGHVLQTVPVSSIGRNVETSQ